MSVRRAIIVILHAFAGWALCAATMGVGMATMETEYALIVHAIGAPIYFIAVTTVYSKKFGYTTPLQTALVFVLFVILTDLFLVALIINRSLEMFTSLLGTWIPFALIFASTYGTAYVVTKARKHTQA